MVASRRDGKRGDGLPSNSFLRVQIELGVAETRGDLYWTALLASIPLK